MQNDVSVNYSQADCGDISHSLVHQPVDYFAFSTPSFTERSEVLTRDLGKIIARPLHSSSVRAEDLEGTLKFTHYGEKLQPQPPIQNKAELFVSHKSQPSPSPLSADWLGLLQVPKRPNAPTTFPFSISVSIITFENSRCITSSMLPDYS